MDVEPKHAINIVISQASFVHIRRSLTLRGGVGQLDYHADINKHPRSIQSVGASTRQVDLKSFNPFLELKIKQQAVLKSVWNTLDDLLNIFQILKKVSSRPTRLFWGGGATVVVSG